MKNKPLSGKTVGIIGLGRSGAAAANLASRLGASVLVSDASPRNALRSMLEHLGKNIKTEFGGHSRKLFESDIIVKSPGVCGGMPVVKEAKKKGIPVIGEIEFALRFMQSVKIIAITGTNGKTTTTTLVGKILQASGKKTIVAGNIGYPPAAAVQKITAATNLVLETSSYQLEDLTSLKPHISSILNITPDQLEHHGTMDKYIRAKTRIFKNQSKNDLCVLNYDDKILRKVSRNCPAKIVFFSRKKRIRGGVYYYNGKIVSNVHLNKFSIDIDLKIPGPHNIENALAAVAICAAAGVGPHTIRKVLNSFKGVEHRIEFCGNIKGVRYYNDSKATNVDSTRVALESFNKGIWLILGGLDKGAPYTPLKHLIKKRVNAVLLIGEAAKKISKDLYGAARFYNCQTIENAVKLSSNVSGSGDIVLLSPACASFDQFKDYEERGRQFKKCVTKLRK